jgi:2-polyprenyl-3-methyl-5-hydroxy-6-metoxy-1,4-benzoquinol methylase
MESTRALEEAYREKDPFYYEFDRREMLPFITADRSGIVLEVGCSSGKFGEVLKKEIGCRVWGIEPTPGVADVAATKLDRAFSATFEHCPEVLAERFDCIVFNDVLEHFPDPYDVLKQCRDLLKPDGAVVASIPNIRHWPTLKAFLVEKDWKYEQAGIMDQTHLRFFTEKSIRRMFEDLGYRVKRLEGINPIHPGLGWRLLNLCSVGYLADTRFLQFAVVASLK